MKITLRNVGALAGPVALEPRKLTVLSGGNNTGKTYAMYVLWALQQRRVRSVFSFSEPIAEKLRDEGTVQIPLRKFCEEHWNALEKGIGEGLKKRLPELFSAPPKSFEDANISVSMDIQSVLDNASRRPEFKRTIEVGSSGRIDVRLGEISGDLGFFITALDVGKIPRSLLSELVSSLFIDLILFAECENAFLLPAERGGLNLFYLDLDAKNAAIVRHLKRDEPNPIE